ncbi:hypothetical protein B5864_16460 [Salmonella enterica]|uniref:Uncharacterized protein n=2 Tax=Salmonella enterica TaxID=28901 RepID=A0A403T788_SALER|nr:hypothetical protein [Salmonella sp. SG203]EAB7740817.1 hypothetical protein [Salmonella enterica subsp. enterica serovar Hadar]EAV6572627.1 hypothetical protein [Salmonella enterica]EBR8260586.1 hypothetical protein [Salmonella enterica subsp. enterica serovar Cerro]EBW7256019.1 hypothetical protein [Salmonella enterica subsp. enterica serovar Gatow]EBX7467737.1 hypothetical protein [Salmonella enterica subsp. enterica serovar Bareilly]ECA3795135.1 hypothetical protein [Salmonella enteric
MRILYRAVCSCAASLHRGFDEKRVFFEVDHNDDAGAYLVALLADIRGVPESTVIYHNLLSEYEYHRKLDTQAGTPVHHSPETGSLRDDMRLFEVMWTYDHERRESVSYLPLSDMPLFLVSPRMHRRLLDAFLACPREEAAEVVNG